jgi:hypothetical protein|tara:strand:- start:70 stop:444 length:375 start_codon:yes stop_codon:yes gene_type:complete
MGKVEKSLIPKGKKYENIETIPEYKLMLKEIKDINDSKEVKRIIDKFIADQAEAKRLEDEQKRINLEAKKRDDAAGMNKGGIPKKNFAKPGSYSSAYNKGGMGKAKVGHTDYRKGGMIYTTKNK